MTLGVGLAIVAVALVALYAERGTDDPVKLALVVWFGLAALTGPR